MKRLTIALALAASVLFAGTALGAGKKAAKKGNPTVVIKTSLGTIEAVLYQDKAPISVENFLAYVKDKHYDGTIFHRVIPNFMIQGGGFTSKFSQKKTRDPIKNEAKNGLKNERGTFAMARTGQVDSATCQFFINLKHSKFLDHGVRDYGYTVFGKVTKGLDVVDKIAAVQTGSKGPFSRDCPKEDVIIKSIRVK